MGCGADATQTLSSSGSLTLAGDLRLDERDDLVEKLGVPPSVSDGDLVLRAYRRWGSGCCRHLRGDYAFVIADTAQSEVFCARDALGVKPLYYARVGGSFLVASEPAAITEVARMGRRPNLQQVALLLTSRHNESGDTLFDGVSALPGGHFLRATHTEVVITRHWCLDPWRQLPVDEAEAAELVREAVQLAISRRLGPGPLALFVSGGLDSAAMAGEVARQRQQCAGVPPTIVHAAFDGTPDDETVYSDAVADRWDLPRINTRPLDDLDVLMPSEARRVDLYWDPRLGVWDQLCQASRAAGLQRGMTGDGVDEVLRATGQEWPDDILALRWGRVLRQVGLAGRPWSPRAWKRLVVGGLLPLFSSLEHRRTQPDLELLAPRYARVTRQQDEAREARHDTRAYPDRVTRDLFAFYLEGDINLVLTLNDRAAAHSGVAVADGLLDVDLIELLLALPHEFRHTAGLDKPKPVLRHAMRNVLPETVVSRRRSGTYVALTEHVLFDGRHRLAESIFSPGSRLAEAGIISSDTGAWLETRAPSPPRGYHRAGWSFMASRLVSMELFLRQL